MRTVGISTPFTVLSSASRCLEQLLYRRLRYVCVTRAFVTKETSYQSHGCRSVDAYRGSLVPGTLVVGAPSLTVVVECPLMPLLLPRTATVHPATRIFHKRISCNVSTISISFLLFQNSGLSKTAGLPTRTSLKSERVLTVLDGATSPIYTYVSLLIQGGQVN